MSVGGTIPSVCKKIPSVGATISVDRYSRAVLSVGTGPAISVGRSSHPVHSQQTRALNEL